MRKGRVRRAGLITGSSNLRRGKGQIGLHPREYESVGANGVKKRTSPLGEGRIVTRRTVGAIFTWVRRKGEQKTTSRKMTMV